MYKILNRFAWIISICIGFFIIYIDINFTILALIVVGIIKFVFLSENFIKSNILDYNKRLEESIVKKLSHEKDEKLFETLIPIQEENISLNTIIPQEEIIPESYGNLEIIEEGSPSKIKVFLKDFFAENLIAKIGGILLALGAIFFMSLIYTLVGETTKIIIGFAVGFGIYFIGLLLQKKGLGTESMILLGTGILINYIVILGGRFIIGDGSEGFLSSGITFFLLIVNTIFSVITAFINKSKNLLLFSLIFAFIIPFLIGDRNIAPYVQLGYGLIIALGGLIISNYFIKNQTIGGAKEVFFISLIGGNILFLTTPLGENSSYFILKMIGFNILTFSALFLAYQNKLQKEILYTFIISLLFLGNIIINGSLELNLSAIMTKTITAFLFIFVTYFLSRKKEYDYLYTLGTLAGIFILFPIIKITGEFMFISIISLVLFGGANFLLPFINSNLVKNQNIHLILGTLFGILFISLEIFRFGNQYFPGPNIGIAYFALAVLYFLGGYIFLKYSQKNQSLTYSEETHFTYTFFGIAISLFSLSIAFIFAQSPSIIAMIWLFQSTLLFFFANRGEKQKIYYAGVILFAIGIAKFGQYFGYLSYDLFEKIKNLNSEEISSSIKNGGFISIYLSHFISLIFIGISLFLNIFIFKKTKFQSIFAVNILHLIGVFILGGNILYLSSNYIIEYLIHGEKFGIAYIILGILMIVLSIIYNLIGNIFTKYALVIFIYITLIFHIFQANMFSSYFLNYIFTSLIGGVIIIDYLFIKSGKLEHFKSLFHQLLGVFGIYIFIITSLYLYHNTGDSFSLTLYWGTLSLIGVYLGISKENQFIRSIGLYLLMMTLLKISFYDVWNTIDNPLIRIIAFMFVGGIMLYISSLYSKKKLQFKSDFAYLWERNKDNTMKNS